LRLEVLKFLGPEVCPPSKTSIRTPGSSALQSLFRSSEEIISEKSLPEGDLVSSIQRARSRSFSDDPSAGETVPIVGSALSVSHIGGFKPSFYAVHHARLFPAPARLEENFD